MDKNKETGNVHLALPYIFFFTNILHMLLLLQDHWVLIFRVISTWLPYIWHIYWHSCTPVHSPVFFLFLDFIIIWSYGKLYSSYQFIDFIINQIVVIEIIGGELVRFWSIHSLIRFGFTFDHMVVIKLKRDRLICFWWLLVIIFWFLMA